jgi:hypothetical protein
MRSHRYSTCSQPYAPVPCSETRRRFYLLQTSSPSPLWGTWPPPKSQPVTPVSTIRTLPAPSFKESSLPPSSAGAKPRPRQVCYTSRPARFSFTRQSLPSPRILRHTQGYIEYTWGHQDPLVTPPVTAGDLPQRSPLLIHDVRDGPG